MGKKDETNPPLGKNGQDTLSGSGDAPAAGQGPALDMAALREQLLADVRAEGDKIVQAAREEGRRIVNEARDIAGQTVLAAYEQVRLTTGQEKMAKEQVVNVQATLAKYPKVKVRFLSGSLPHEKTPVQFGFAGVPYTLARDVDHLLPEPVVKYHQNNTTSAQVMDPTDPSGRKMRRTTVPSLPMQIVEWPAKEKQE